MFPSLTHNSEECPLLAVLVEDDARRRCETGRRLLRPAFLLRLTRRAVVFAGGVCRVEAVFVRRPCAVGFRRRRFVRPLFTLCGGLRRLCVIPCRLRPGVGGDFGVCRQRETAAGPLRRFAEDACELLRVDGPAVPVVLGFELVTTPTPEGGGFSKHALAPATRYALKAQSEP